MKVISGQWGEYMDYCKENNMMPTEEGFRIYKNPPDVVRLRKAADGPKEQLDLCASVVRRV